MYIQRRDLHDLEFIFLLQVATQHHCGIISMVTNTDTNQSDYLMDTTQEKSSVQNVCH